LEQGKEKKEGEKIYIRKKRRKRRYRRSLWSMIKRGAIWGISIGIAILSIIFALLSYKW
jgi:cell division septal protein FtsQ